MSQTDPYGGAERRAGERGAYRCPAEVMLDESDRLRGHTLDLSATGALLVLPRKIELGREYRLRLILDDGKPPLEIWAMGIRSAEPSGSSSRPVRIGMTFILPPMDAVLRIRNLLYQSLPT